MDQKKIRAVIINMKDDTQKRGQIINLLTTINIVDFEIIDAFEAQNVRFTKDGLHVEFDDYLYNYGPYNGDFPFRREYLSRGSIGCCLSNKIARENQKAGYFTIIFEDDAELTTTPDDWEKYMHNFPKEEDYDIIFFSDIAWSGKSYPKGEFYNEYYYYLTLPHFDISGTHSYVVNPKILALLNGNFNLNLAADDYLNCCINQYALRVLVSAKPWFTQNRHW